MQNSKKMYVIIGLVVVAIFVAVVLIINIPNVKKMSPPEGTDDYIKMETGNEAIWNGPLDENYKSISVDEYNKKYGEVESIYKDFEAPADMLLMDHNYHLIMEDGEYKKIHDEAYLFGESGNAPDAYDLEIYFSAEGTPYTDYAYDVLTDDFSRVNEVLLQISKEEHEGDNYYFAMSQKSEKSGLSYIIVGRCMTDDEFVDILKKVVK